MRPDRNELDEALEIDLLRVLEVGIDQRVLHGVVDFVVGELGPEIPQDFLYVDVTRRRVVQLLKSFLGALEPELLVVPLQLSPVQLGRQELGLLDPVRVVVQANATHE